MITKEEFEKAVNYCTELTVSCKDCPLSEKDLKCGACLTEYIRKNESAPGATGTSSEVSVKEDTDNIHLNDSKLLDICQEELEEISEIALGDFPNEYLTGYIVALKKNIKRLRGEPSD